MRVVEISFIGEKRSCQFELLHGVESGGSRLFVHDKDLAKDLAIVLTPFCDTRAQPISELPSFDVLKVHPVRFGCPDFSLIELAGYKRLKDRFLLNEFKDIGFPIPNCSDQEFTAPSEECEIKWLEFLDRRGNRMLWNECATQEMRREWLNDFDDYGYLLMLLLCAQRNEGELRTLERTIIAQDLKRICYLAEFWKGDSCVILFLEACRREQLTTKELSFSPQRRDQEEKLEALKFANREAAAQRSAKTVTLDDARKQLGALRKGGKKLSVKQTNNICKKYNVGLPVIQEDLDRIIERHKDQRQQNSEEIARRNKSRVPSERSKHFKKHSNLLISEQDESISGRVNLQIDEKLKKITCSP
jgi:hypothetical protein